MTKVEVRPGVWKLSVTVGRYEDGRLRREHRTVHVRGADRANRALAEFAAEVKGAPLPRTQSERDICVDDAIDLFLTHLRDDKGREAGTIRDYRSVHDKWFSPVIGERRVRDVDEEDIDRIFGKMRRGGLSASRMQAARNLYGPFFRWARRRRMIQRNPMAEFEMPTSMYVAQEWVPPEVEQLCVYLATAVDVIPDVTPVLTLGAVTGMRRGELVAVRRSRLHPERGYLRVDAAVDDTGPKVTKTDWSAMSSWTRRRSRCSCVTASGWMSGRHCLELRMATATGHKLRHTCFTRLREAGMALEAIQAQARHASIESTRIYLYLANDWLEKEYLRAAEAIDAQTVPARSAGSASTV